ncbi:hypothetical protein LZD49_20380 [Dyadobacter sp. CY261]|uniref:hypothetical protein n=1 Tax=Dyadobacter sp. CY261 TaxID=2907203 RepID=UPI001F44B720|nr:hypothetical protein [Dyadobacter sp. CY261]MCF0072849.1 hypothetical protein [Dyadobacter sp. CY261]
MNAMKRIRRQVLALDGLSAVLMLGAMPAEMRSAVLVAVATNQQPIGQIYQQHYPDGPLSDVLSKNENTLSF